MQPWCNTISSAGAIGTTSASTNINKSRISRSSSSTSGTAPTRTSSSGTSGTTSSSTTPGGVEKHCKLTYY